VAFNLPVGSVMTLMDNVVTVASGDLPTDFKNCGRCIDLVGTGQTEGVDLTQCNMNDCVSAFIWREVDLDMGAIELFDDINFGGNRTTLFLGEWPLDKVISIGDWWLNDRVSSVRWHMLNDLQTVALFENADGSGRAYQNVKGWGKTKEIANLNDVVFNDCMSSFSWDAQVPLKEVVAAVTMPLDVVMDDAQSVSDDASGPNDGPAPLNVPLSIQRSDVQQLQITLTNSWVVGTKIGGSYSWDAGIEKGTLTFELSFTYTRTETSVTTMTTTIQLNVGENVTAVPYSYYTASLIAQIGKVPPTTFKTKATRWYAEPVTGSVADPDNHNWYKRIEDVTGTIAGGLHAGTQTSVKCVPLPGHENDPQFQTGGGKTSSAPAQQQAAAGSGKTN
jgi:hypothetical protein